MRQTIKSLSLLAFLMIVLAAVSAAPVQAAYLQGSPDMTVTKTNNVSGTTDLFDVNSGAWQWTITVSNSGTAAATFADGEVILIDDWPTANLGPPGIGVSSSGLSGTGTVNIDIADSLTISVGGGSPVIFAPGGYVQLVVTDTPTLQGTFDNPRSGGVCSVDPNNVIAEGDENNNTCSDSVTVYASDLTAIKSNDVSDTVVLGSSFTWSVQVQNIGNKDTAFAAGERILNDGLPTTGVTYGAVTVTGESGITGSPNCFIAGSNDAVLCNANAAGTTIGAGGEFTVNVVMTPTATGILTNPTGGFCRVDPQNLIDEPNDEVNGTNNNDCGPDVVTVIAPDLAVQKTTDDAQAQVGGTFPFDYVLSNVGTAEWTFTEGEVFFHDDLDTNHGSYADGVIVPTVTTGVSTTGTGFTCEILDAVLECTVDAASTTTFLMSGTLEFTVTGGAVSEGGIRNPSDTGICQINPVVPNGPAAEENYANNDCFVELNAYVPIVPEAPGPDYSIAGTGTANGNIISWGWQVCNLMEGASPGLSVRFDVGSDQTYNSSVPAGTVDGQTLWVPLDPLQPDECAQISIETTYTGGSASAAGSMRARAVHGAALQGTLVCMDGSVADVSARACAALGGAAAAAPAEEFPTTLPETGGQPVAEFPVWAAVLAGLLALGAVTGFLLKKRAAA